MVEVPFNRSGLRPSGCSPQHPWGCAPRWYRPGLRPGNGSQHTYKEIALQHSDCQSSNPKPPALSRGREEPGVCPRDLLHWFYCNGRVKRGTAFWGAGSGILVPTHANESAPPRADRGSVRLARLGGGVCAWLKQMGSGKTVTGNCEQSVKRPP